MPARLEVSARGGGLLIEVIGESARDVALRFSLETDSDVAGGGNRTRHQGGGRLRAGQRQVLSSVALGAVRPGGWRAALAVALEDGSVYEQSRDSL